MVGNYSDLAGNRHGFLWSAREGLIDLGPEFLAVAINNRRQIAGRCPGEFGEEFQEVNACLWEDGVVRPLGFSVGASWTDSSTWVPVDINDRGEFVGEAWLWSAKKGLVALPLASAHTVNNSGLIVGHMAEHTVVLSKRGRVLRTGRGDLQPTAINSRGWVTGFYWDQTGGQWSFVWLPCGRVITLPSSSNDSYAGEINNRGQIAGSARISDEMLHHAMLWTVRASNAKKE